MANMNAFQRARQQGGLAAARELRRLKVDQTKSVDVFRIITQSNVWLLFQPLEDLLGVYLREGSGGILVNARRLRSLQRLTAAHEFGHHVLKHSSSLDKDEDIDNPNASRKIEEAAAQSFALDFLMPPSLVSLMWQKLALPARIDAAQAYLLSLHLGTSYKATVYQLAAQDRIAADEAQLLLRVQPKEVKKLLGRGTGPANPWAEVWPLDEAQSGRELTIGVEDEVSISLSETPSTGYVWVFESPNGEASGPRAGAAPHGGADGPDSPSPVETVRSEFDPLASGLLGDAVGSEGHRYFRLRAVRPGECEVRLALRRPWLPNTPAAREFAVRVHCAQSPTGETGKGYLAAVRESDLALRDHAA